MAVFPVTVTGGTAERNKGLKEIAITKLKPFEGHPYKVIDNEEMTALMGSNAAKLTWSSSTPTIYMLCGLQGGITEEEAAEAKRLVTEIRKRLYLKKDIWM